MTRALFFFRTGALLALFGAGSLLFQKPEGKGITFPSFGTSTVTIEAGSARDGENTKTPSQPFLAQILETLELGQTNEILASLSDTPKNSFLNDTGESETWDNASPLAKAIAAYLTQQSSIGGELSSQKIQAALSLATRGDPGGLERIAQDYRRMRQEAQVIGAPPELISQHEATLQVLDRFAAFIEALAKQPTDQIAALWNGTERKAIAEEALRIQNEVRAVVKQYQVVLPLGVLP